MKVSRIIGTSLCVCVLATFVLWALWPTPYFEPAANCFLVRGYSRTNDSIVVQVIFTNQYRRAILYQDPTGTAGPGVKVSVTTKTGETNFPSGDLGNAGWHSLRAGATKGFSVTLPGDTVSWRASTALLAPSARMRFLIQCTDAGLYRLLNENTIESIASLVPNRMSSKWEIQSAEFRVP
jgi:hypothetical protein